MFNSYLKETSQSRIGGLGTLTNILKNGGKGSGNFGHSGRPGKVGGSSSGGLSGISKALATQKKFQDQAKIVQEEIEDRIGQKVKKGEEYSALDEASTSRFKYFHGEDGTEYTYDKGNGMITKTNPETGDEEVVTKKKERLGEKGDSYWGDAKQGIELLDGSKEDIVEQTRRQYGEDYAKQIKTEIERTKEHLSMVPDDWAVRIDRVSPGMLETKLASKYKIGDEFSIDGETMKVVEGDKPGTIMGVSEDKKRFARVPDERLFELARLESQTTLSKENYDVIRKIADGGKFNEKDAAERIIANIEEWSKKKGTA